MNTSTLLGDLSRRIAGDVFDDPVRRTLLATDGSIFSRMPAAVVYPRNTADVQAVVRFCAAQGLSLHPRGAGSGLCGSAIGDGVVLDFSKYMNRLTALDLDNGWFECEPGYRLGQLEAAIKGSAWFFPPDPSSGEYATFGGMCATNASGAHSVKYGNLADYLLDAQVVTADGRVLTLDDIGARPIDQLPNPLAGLARLYLENAAAIESAYPAIACNVAGYNLRGLVQNDHLRLHRLLCGAEGTLAVATRLRLRLQPKPAADSLVVAYCDDILQAARAAQAAIELAPSGIEIMDKSLLAFALDVDARLREQIPAGVDNVLMIEFDDADCADRATEIQRRLKAAGLTRQCHLAVSAAEKQSFWSLRKAAVPILYKLKGRRKILALVEDAAIPVAHLAEYFEGIYALFKRLKVEFVLYGHIAKGLMHTRPLLDLKDPHDVGLLRTIADEVYALADRLEGTVSGEHGDGRLRSAYVQRKYPTIYPLFERVKRLLDPQAMFNPGIKLPHDPDQMTRGLRFGGDYRSHSIADLRLAWNGAFAEEVEKCHGCAKCTTVTEATRMCPVYKQTRDEAATPRAKANILRALISGALDDRCLYDTAVRQVMAQCVNCGSCLTECPSNVNIPKLAMEAKAQYHRRFGVPLAERLTAHVETAARALHPFAPLISPLTRRPPVRRAAARLTGLEASRELVEFSARTLFDRTTSDRPGPGPSVLYYAGCYAAFIRPELGLSAVKLLRHLGLRVLVPPQWCCGLPLFSKGMADGARRKIRKNLRAWKPLLDQVDHIVVTCSSCGYALMQDWAYFTADPAAGQAAQKTIHISRLLLQHRERIGQAHLPKTVAYHQPCHLRLQPQPDSSLRLLGAVPGLRVQALPNRCCGMAGSWGLIGANYPLSTAIAEPLIRPLRLSRADYAVTDCPTCQMQMAHLGNLPVRHPAEVVWEGLLNR
jgi:FAD/FMN-containing dehydrogenase/Fe-S oxidoreductase